MKKLLLIVAMFTTCVAFAQKKEKIKGNKEVIEVYNNLPPYTSLEISDGLEVLLMQTGASGYRIKTDSNLVDVIKVEVVDKILKLYTTMHISSSKKLEINLTSSQINTINLSQGSKLESQNLIQSDSLTISTFNNSKYNLDLASKYLAVNMQGSSNGKIIYRGDDILMNLNESALIKGSISATNFDLTINDRADMNIEGNCDNLNLIATGSTDIKAKDLNVMHAKINGSNNSDIYIYSNKDLTLYAKGKSNVYVYGNPKINVEGLSDKSQIIKK
ncbi:hypothetical protein PW52_02900 [Tamlana sedimentorum]|uniref:Putative auto-transporter adhesin head GIN domain-containing protein n=1 Tax=Neotamlana sedimentorum TaxID=1435349 RepID=A0A0D7WBQ4_9FLAO|nr:head GIN domain-containing protein [Tamlana sedimentorum]KJD36610.1 hypothetical protein PW52_02900 [Tamlana sedimentorum]